MKVILAAGGSGGHIFPSIALAAELEKIGVREIFFVSSKRGLDRNILDKSKHPSFFLSVNPMPFGFSPARWIVFAFKLISDTVVSAFLLVKIKPDVVVGFGGYSSGAIVKCAGLLNISVLIHEQNFLPGRANRMLSRKADRVAVSFPETAKCFPGAHDNVVFTGNPIRLEMLTNDKREAARHLGLSPDRQTVLVMGGSQGSTFLNTVASKAACLINEKQPGRFQFIHLTGSKDLENISRSYLEKSIPAKVFSFLDRIDHAYSLCDLAISRSGAAAIFELAFYSKPMILVPYPSPRNNQRFNAVYFSQKGAAVHKEECDLSAEKLAEEVIKILTDKEKWRNMYGAAAGLANPGAGKSLAAEVVKLAS